MVATLRRKSLTVLILTRRVGEALIIGDSVAVTVLGTDGRQVRLGIEADKRIPVHREEIYEQIKRRRLRDRNSLRSTAPNERDLPPSATDSAAEP